MLAKEKAFSDAHHYRVTKESEANQKKVHPQLSEIRTLSISIE